MKTICFFSLLLFISTSSAGGLPVRSDVMSMIPYMTSVKNQGQRNLCTIFSFTALLETIMLKKYPNLSAKSLNFSEEWVQYVFALRSDGGGALGARLDDIYRQVDKYGVANEKYLPYDGTLWSAKGPEKAIERCGHIPTANKARTRCYSSHYSPFLVNDSDEELENQGFGSFAKARTSAQENFELIGNMSPHVISFQKAKELLSQGYPVVLKLRFYYGSWNHSAGSALGIDTDSNLYTQGIVTYPEVGSVDKILSEKAHANGNPAIHSVLLIGYDDTIEVKYNKLMSDGTVKQFVKRGVFYFKNSWDPKKFGKKFKIGKKTIPGFGMILQDHTKVQDSRPEFFTITI